ncbi:MAG TPA: ATP-binding protein, partial [Mycobacterium sp.]
VEPFRRGYRQRVGQGTGLGLSIVRTIVAAHGGRLNVNAIDGGGLAINISLPSSPESDGVGRKARGESQPAGSQSWV